MGRYLLTHHFCLEHPVYPYPRIKFWPTSIFSLEFPSLSLNFPLSSQVPLAFGSAGFYNPAGHWPREGRYFRNTVFFAWFEWKQRTSKWWWHRDGRKDWYESFHKFLGMLSQMWWFDNLKWSEWTYTAPSMLILSYYFTKHISLTGFKLQADLKDNLDLKINLLNIV